MKKSPVYYPKFFFGWMVVAFVVMTIGACSSSKSDEMVEDSEKEDSLSLDFFFSTLLDLFKFDNF